MIVEFSVKTNQGSYDIEAYVRCVGKDLVVVIWGGERPHVGAVAIAQPRPSLKDPQVTSSTASVFCILGHKEDEVAKAVSEILAASLHTTVVVTAGIHWDDITQEGLNAILENTKILVDMILDKIAQTGQT